MNVHDAIRLHHRIVPYRANGLLGQCFEPFAGLSLESIPWDALRRNPDPRYRLEKSSETRRVVSFDWTLEGAQGNKVTIRLYAKRAQIRKFWRLALAPFRASKAKKEWRLGLALLDAGIPTPLPVLYAERRRFGALTENFLATVGLQGATSFHQRFQKLAPGPERLAALGALARFVRSGHEKGFYHDDCSAHHIFVEEASGSQSADPAMYFIDVDNCRLRRRPAEWFRVKNCFQLFRSLPPGSLTAAEKARFLSVYLDRPLSEVEIDDYLLKVEMWQEWKKQRKRLLKLLRARPER